MESTGITFGPELCIHCPLLLRSLILTLLIPLPFCILALATLGTRGRLRFALGVPLLALALYVVLTAALMVSRFGIDWRWHRADYGIEQATWSAGPVLLLWLALLVALSRQAYRWASRLAA